MENYCFGSRETGIFDSTCTDHGLAFRCAVVPAYGPMDDVALSCLALTNVAIYFRGFYRPYRMLMCSVVQVVQRYVLTSIGLPHSIGSAYGNLALVGLISFIRLVRPRAFETYRCT